MDAQAAQGSKASLDSCGWAGARPGLISLAGMVRLHDPQLERSDVAEMEVSSVEAVAYTHQGSVLRTHLGVSLREHIGSFLGEWRLLVDAKRTCASSQRDSLAGGRSRGLVPKTRPSWSNTTTRNC